MTILHGIAGKGAHFMQTWDLGVILNRGAVDDGPHFNDGVRGTILVSLGVDDDRDEVTVETAGARSALGVIADAIQALDAMLTELQQAGQRFN